MVGRSARLNSHSALEQSLRLRRVSGCMGNLCQAMPAVGFLRRITSVNDPVVFGRFQQALLSPLCITRPFVQPGQLIVGPKRVNGPSVWSVGSCAFAKTAALSIASSHCQRLLRPVCRRLIAVETKKAGGDEKFGRRDAKRGLYW